MKTKDYHGKILHGNYSHALKMYVAENISRLADFEKTGVPAIPYLSAWHREQNTMWYEFAGIRFCELMACPASEVAEVFRESILEHRIYDYQGENQTRINPRTLRQSELTVSRKSLRAQGEKRGLVEAIYKVRLADGTMVWLKDQARVAAFNEDQVHISSGCLTHVTKEMETEEALIRTQKMLEEKARALSLARKVQEENAARLSSAIEQTEAARKEAEKANKAKNEFLAVISHEIRNPMNGIVGTCDLIMADDLSNPQKEYLEIIRNSAFSLLGLINDILDFSKIEAGRLEFQEICFDVRDVIEEVSDIFLEMISRKNLEFIVDVDPDVPARVMADPMRLRQVLINLTSNALKFTSQGEIVIRVEQTRREKEMAELVFRVMDTGIGIAAEHFDRLFESFTQINDGRHTEFGGTGLGLAICRQIVEMMNGTIGVDSLPGQGSTFHFKVSFKCVDPPPEKGTEISAGFTLSHALVVLENRSGLSALDQVLKSWGFQVTAYTAGLDAADLHDTKISRFDLVILDMGFKGLEDETIFEKLKSMTSSAGLAVALIRMGRNDDLVRAREMGLPASLTKPVKPSLLLNLIKEKCGTAIETKNHSLEKKQGSDKLFSNTRVLLVEDNTINLKIGFEMLRMAGLDVDTAGNGIEAIEKVQTTRYAALLIDIQMPHLNGIEASRIIRHQFSKTRLPIIAMSAHTKSDHWQACQDAGINDYILKPVSRNVLFTVLKKQLKMSGRSMPVPEPVLQKDGETDWSSPDVKMLPGLNIKEGIERLGGAVPIYAEILNDFCNAYADFDVKLEIFLARSDFKGAAGLSHSLKGASGNVSALSLFESAKALENACRQKQNHEIPRLLNLVQSDYETVCRSARMFIERVRSEKSHKMKKTPVLPAEPMELKTLTQSLASSLEQCDPVESETLVQKMKPLADRAWHKEMDLLIQAVKSYQFEDANYYLKTILEKIQNNSPITED
jgi:two-component system, sensor histidine kinase and response regulator